MSELKPCRCGCIPDVYLEARLMATGDEFYYVCCPLCGLMQYKSYSTAEEAKRKWNESMDSFKRKMLEGKENETTHL